MKVISIGIKGGMVNWVTGIPDDVEVHVYDYDIDSADETLVVKDPDSRKCILTVFRSSNNESG